MKLRRGRARYKIPAHSEILSVCIDGNQRYNQMASILLQAVPWFELPHLGESGLPTRFAVLNEQIEFWPIPDRAYKVTVRYVPPVQEF